MKVGILTFHRSINYGAFMQAYSLSHRIHEDTGAEVEIIDYEPRVVHDFYLRNILINRRAPFGIFKRLSQYRAFRRSLSRLPLSGHTILSRSQEPLFEHVRGRYDVIVVGSDAVWNSRIRGFPNAYFLHEDLGCVKMSYAASAHGMDISGVTESQRAFIGKALQDFRYIGVRDRATESLVHEAAPGIEVHHNCDPTVLLPMDADTTALRARLKRRYGMDVTRPMIGLMSVSRQFGHRIREHYGSRYHIVSLYGNNPYADVFLHDLTPFEWAQVFAFFRITFTQYFHGMLLSLKNETPVIALDFWANQGLYPGKMEDFLMRTGLDSCYFAEKSMTDAEWSRLFSMADAQIAEPPTRRIQQGLQSEARCYASFQASLQGVRGHSGAVK